ncbi:protein PALS1 isoform X1 [Hydra vulgaris]|uniref:MAGUK p55 subfamily member 5 n=1 Tax=Hydra vulgaris TaxID=6087 RepID=T2M9J3_HYDVU|nr:protein PALS1 [Hydra vulgaris]
MDNRLVTKKNGYVSNGYSFTSGAENIKALSNSKVSLHSLRSNASSTSEKLNNGYQSSNNLADCEISTILIEMGPSDRRFGFSVMGGIDEGFPPRIDDISPGSPAERCGLQLEDELLEVNGINVEHITHAEIIMKIHKSKVQILLKIRRYLSSKTEEKKYISSKTEERKYVQQKTDNQYGNKMSPIKTNGYISKTNGESSPVSITTPGMLKFKRQPVADRVSNIPSRFINEAFHRDEFDDSFADDDDNDVSSDTKSLGFSKFVALLDVMRKSTSQHQQDDIAFFQNLLYLKQFQDCIKIHNQMSKAAIKKRNDSMKPVATNSTFLLSEVNNLLMGLNDPGAIKLLNIINRPFFKELLNAHDHIAMRESLDSFPEIENESEYDQDDINEFIDDQRVKIVRIDKTNKPLGATVKNEGDAVIISRIIKGGAAEKSELLHEGDEILEINNQSVKGKNIDEVVELLSELEGTITFVLLPTSIHKDTQFEEGVFLKALFDYNPKDDQYLPCPELGLPFVKGDLLKIINQSDPDWWQARNVNGDQQGLAGLIPSKKFQLQREKSKIVLHGDDNEPIISEKKHFLCGRRKRKVKKFKSFKNSPVDEILTYEEMVKKDPDPGRRRPVVLIGPPQVGRRELRDRLISENPNKYGLAVAHTTRVPESGEIDKEDYIFVNKSAFEKLVDAAEFIEYGQYSGHYYGTSFNAVRNVVRSGKTCILNMNCQSLPILKNSNLLPYIIFITLPPINQLKRLREFDDTCEPFNPNIRLEDKEIPDILEKARDISRTHGHYFDKVIVNNEFEHTYAELVETLNRLETQPQWLPLTWVR